MARMVRAERAMYPDLDEVVARAMEKRRKPTLVTNFDVALSVGGQRLRGILEVDQFFATDWILQYQEPIRERDLHRVGDIIEAGSATFFDEDNFSLLRAMQAAVHGPHSNRCESITFGELNDAQIEVVEDLLVVEKRGRGKDLVRNNRLTLDRLVSDSIRPNVAISVEGKVFVRGDIPIELDVCLSYLHRSLTFSRQLVLTLIPFEEARVWIEKYEGAEPGERSREMMDFVNSLLDGARLDVL